MGHFTSYVHRIALDHGVIVEYGGEGIQWLREQVEINAELFERLEMRDSQDNSYVGEIRWRENPETPTMILLTWFYFEEQWRLRGYGRWNGGAMLDEVTASGHTFIQAVGMSNETIFREKFQIPRVELDLLDEESPFRRWIRATPYPRRPESA